ncbi:hypothetical protein AB0I28_00085 [Phytomonospora sp. NPDC050363]|uniref:hypothetical protein n=1 Tax=Phytomonospora sp. NPDC050363 TaxID=3155642 RepID=UPI0033C4120F
MPVLPPSIARAVEVSRRHFPAAAGDMEAALPVLLDPLLPAGDSARWRLSPLTDGGFPFEMTFSTNGDGPSYTLEVGPGGTPPGARLARAVELLAGVGGEPADDGTLARLTRWQARGGLTYGAWLGARHGPAGSDYKIYAEVPEAARARVAAHFRRRLGGPAVLPARRQEPQMVGWYPYGGGLELYARIHGLRPWELAALMSPLGLQSRAPAVLAVFEDVLGRPFGQRLPGPLFGYSYSLPAPGSGRGAAFSFFSFCEVLARGDAGIRRRLRGHWERRGACMDYYTDMSEPTTGHPGPWNHHGLLGVTVTDDAEPVSYVGLRPPEAI